MRIACVYLHNMAVQLAVVNNPGLAGPLVIGGLPFEAGSVLDASPEAMASGVKPRMALRQAYSLCPDARFLPSNKAACEEAFEEVLRVLDHTSPIVDVEKLGCAYIDVTGVPEEQELIREMSLNIRSSTRLESYVGVSTGKFFARTAAFTSKSEIPLILGVGAEKEFIAPYSVEFLPCLPETRERLHLLGIRFIGQLTRFPREALIAQFGLEGKKAYELATGFDPSLLVPRKKPETAVDTIELCPPLESCIDIARACEVVLYRLLPEIKNQGKLCSKVCLRLKFESSPPQAKALPFKNATISQPAIMKRIEAWLQEIKVPAPVNGVEISLRFIGEEGRRLPLWRDFKEERGPGKVARELKARFGYQPLKRVQVVDQGAILPERRTRLIEIVEQKLEP